MLEHPRLLVPLDGSAVAEAAIPYAEALACSLSGSLQLLAVVEPEPGGPFALAPEIRSQLTQAQQQEFAGYLERIARRGHARAIPVETRTAVGDATEAILAAAAESTPTIVVMATHGRGGLQRLLLGSVADKVMRLAPCLILLVTPDEDPPAKHTVSLHRIAVPLDGSPLAEAALAPAGTLAQAAEAALLLVRVEPWLVTALTPYPYAPPREVLDGELEQRARAYLDAVRHRVPHRVATESAVLRGTPAATLADYFREQHIDLVVMTTHGRGGLRRLVLGSTADRLIRLGLPVLLIRPSKATAGTEAEAATTAVQAAGEGRIERNEEFRQCAAC